MKKTLSTLLIILLCVPSAMAQEMPAPRRMPRTPVSREALESVHDVAPASHQAQGQATIMDGEKLRIGESDLRLFGIVPPQLGASFGPQARNALDALTSNQTTSCVIRDRDREGRMLATCHNAAGNDLALELLKRGLAVTARGSLTNTEFATSYLAAEQAAQNARTGLWSVAPPAPAPASAYVASPAPVAAPVVVATPVVVPPVTPPVPTVTAPVVVVAKPVAVPDVKTEIKKDEKIIVDTPKPTHADDAAWAPPASVGFFERYQILIACGLMLATTLSIITALWAQKRRDRMDEMKSVAAALRGELMAARSVCIGRAKSITSDDDDHSVLWPRIRSTLYQASVTRLGILGADLARHIASIYGQSADYAALYSPTTGTQDAPKKRALETLAKHIDNILPTLAHIERTGNLPRKPLAPIQQAPAQQTPIQYEPVEAAREETVPAPFAPTYRDAPRVPTVAPAPLPRASSESMPEQGVPQVTARETIAPQAKKPSAFPFKTLPTDIIHEITSPPASFTRDSPPINVIHSTPIGRASVSLWDNLRNLFQTGSSSVPADPAPLPVDEYGEYAAMIEADMAHYQYGETIESFDISPHKKRG